MIRSVAYLSYHTSPLLAPGSGHSGGMNVYIDDLAREMAKRGVDVDVYTRRADPDVPEVVPVTDHYRVIHVDAGPPEPMTIGALREWVVPFTDGALSVADRRSQPYDLIHSHYWLSGLVGLAMKRALGIPLANSFHTLGLVKDLTRRSGESASSLTRILTEHDVIEGSDCVIAATPVEARDMLEHYGADPTRLCMNPPGVSHDLFVPGDKREARDRLGLDRRPTVVFAGRIQPLKGVDVALEAIALLRRQVPDVHLLVVGGPSGIVGHEEAQRLHARATEEDLAGAVTFLPAQPHDELADFYRAADVVVCPSRSESFGLVAVEAQACATPIVAANVGGLSFGVSADVSGLLIDGWDPRDYAEALRKIITDPGLARVLSEGARQRASIFTWKATTDRLLELYEGITA